MENCLENLSIDEIQDATFLEGGSPCEDHDSPWICPLNWRRPDYILQSLEILSKLDIDVFGCFDGRIPVDYLVASTAYFDFVNGDISEDLLLDALRILLDAMKQQSKARLPVPKHVIMNIQDRFHVEMLMKYIDTLHGTYDDRRVSFLMKALDMALSVGADINQDRCSLSCRCRMSPKAVFCMQPSSFHDFVQPHFKNGVTYPTAPALFANIAEFYEILYVHGNKPGRTWSNFLSQVVSFERPELYKVIEMTLSLMDHEDWQYAQRMLSRLHHRIARSNPVNSAAKETKDRKLELIETCQGPKTLKDMCRNVLYNAVQDRRMAVYVGRLPLPKIIKAFLLFK